MLIREFVSPKVEKEQLFRQMLDPKQHRGQVMEVAPDTTTSGHLGAKKTSDRVFRQIFTGQGYWTTSNAILRHVISAKKTSPQRKSR